MSGLRRSLDRARRLRAAALSRGITTAPGRVGALLAGLLVAGLALAMALAMALASSEAGEAAVTGGPTWPVPGGAPDAPVQSGRLPLRQGLTLSYASTITGEPDYEEIVVVERADSDATQLRTAWNRGTSRRWQVTQRVVSRRERLRARSFFFWNKQGDTAQFRGYAYNMGTGVVLAELKRDGRAEVAVLVPEEVKRTAYRGTLTRVGTAPEQFRVTMDGRQVSLPAIRARGVLSNPIAPDPQLKMEFVFLDDPEVPWYLDSRMENAAGVGGRKVLVRIASSSVQEDVAEALRTRCQAHVNDIYFATGSAEMDSASLPAIRRIAAALQANPAWQLTLLGHTDSIGAAAANLELSRRRSEAVRALLVRGHGIAASRLTADGRGELEPLEDNAAPVGRARNRRVELKRKCD